MTSAGHFVQLTAETLINALNSLDTEITGLLETWRGISATTYQAGWQETKQGATTVLEALSNIAELLGVISRTFSDQDTSNANDYGSLDIWTPQGENIMTDSGFQVELTELDNITTRVSNFIGFLTAASPASSSA